MMDTKKNGWRVKEEENTVDLGVRRRGITNKGMTFFFF